MLPIHHLSVLGLFLDPGKKGVSLAWLIGRLPLAAAWAGAGAPEVVAAGAAGAVVGAASVVVVEVYECRKY